MFSSSSTHSALNGEEPSANGQHEHVKRENSGGAKSEGHGTAESARANAREEFFSNLATSPSSAGGSTTRMTTFNQSSSYNRTFERKVFEEAGGAPTMRLLSSSPLHTIRSTMASDLGIGGGLGSGAGAGLGADFVQPHNYQFGTATSGSFHSSDDHLSVHMDCAAFAPEELKVSVVGSQIVVEGKHAEKRDALGSIERHFVRKFALPRNAHPDTVQSNLTSDGQLTVTASAPKVKETSPGRSIPIKIVHQQTASSTGTSAQNGQQSSSAAPQNGL